MDNSGTGDRPRGNPGPVLMPAADVATVRGRLEMVGGMAEVEEPTPFDQEYELVDLDPPELDGQDGEGEGTHPADLASDYRDDTPPVQTPEPPDILAPPLAGAKKRGPGRPPKPVPPSPPVGDLPTPLPPHYKYATGDPAGRRPTDAMRWFNNLEPWAKDRIMVYGYRHWPVIHTGAVAGVAPVKVEGEKDPVKNESNIFKLSGQLMFKSIEEFTRRYGSGDYEIRINDQLKLKKTILHMWIRDLRDPEHPPNIENPNWILKDDPSNRSYINSLRAKGVKLPWETKDEQADKEREEQEMAEIRAATAVNDKLVDALVGRLEKAESAQGQAPVASGPDPVAYAQMKSADIMAETFKRSMETMQAAADPMANLGKMMELVKGMMPPPPPPDQTTAQLFTYLDKLTARTQEQDDRYHKLQEEIAREKQSRLEQQVEQIRNQLAGGGGVPQGQVIPTQLQPTDTLRARVEELREWKALLSGKDPDGDGDEEPKPAADEGWTKHIPLLLNVAMMGMGMWASIQHNAAVARTGQGVPMAPPNPMDSLPGMGGGEEQSAAQPQARRPAPGANGHPQPPSQAQAQQEQEGIAQLMALMARIEQPLIEHLRSPEKGGVDFAEWFIMSEQDGLIRYRKLKERLDVEMLYAMLMSHPPLSMKLSGMETSVKQFLGEFLQYEELVAAEGAGESLIPEVLPPAGGNPGVGPAVDNRPRRKVS
jgi:hypothetical protein